MTQQTFAIFPQPRRRAGPVGRAAPFVQTERLSKPRNAVQCIALIGPAARVGNDSIRNDTAPRHGPRLRKQFSHCHFPFSVLSAYSASGTSAVAIDNKIEQAMVSQCFLLHFFFHWEFPPSDKTTSDGVQQLCLGY